VSENTLLIPFTGMNFLVLRIPGIFTMAPLVNLTCDVLSSEQLHLCNGRPTPCTFIMTE